MADLYEISPAQNRSSHAIFVHGLSGHFAFTWRAEDKAKRYWQADTKATHNWLEWLEQDNPDLKVWTVGYEAPISLWHGTAMHLTDRATNVLERLVAEDGLQTGEISLIGHSLGGLVIKQLLHDADSMAHSRQDIANFIKRVRRIAFLATPHSGSNYANLADRLRIIFLPSAATASLYRNDPNLRSLSHWYREWHEKNRLETLILVENKGVGPGGLIVPPDSGDPGLPIRPITVSASHSSICKPKSRGNEVYVFVKQFLSRPIAPVMKFDNINLRNQFAQFRAAIAAFEEGLSETQTSRTSPSETITAQGETGAALLPYALSESQTSRASQGETIAQAETATGLMPYALSEHAASAPRLVQYPAALVNAEIKASLLRIRTGRTLIGFGSAGEALNLLVKVQNGDWSGGDAQIRCEALAWCARLLSKEHYDIALQAFESARALGSTIEVKIAEAFLLSAKENFDGALLILNSISQPIAKSAAVYVSAQRVREAALIDWLDESGISFADLDSDGKCVIAIRCQQLGLWDRVVEIAHSFATNDYDITGAASFVAAISELSTTVPEDLRTALLGRIPIGPCAFPLASTADAFAARRRAHGLFLKCASVARNVGCVEAANNAEDFALWLELRDPSQKAAALEKLEISMRDSTHSLRRVSLAIDFGIALDLNAVEAAVDREFEISSGKSFDAAIARFALLTTRHKPKDVLAYMDQHQVQLERHFDSKKLNFIRLEALVKSGQQSSALTLFDHLVTDGLTEGELLEAKQKLMEGPIDAQIKKFEESQQIGDLLLLLTHLEEEINLPLLAKYAAIFFERTKSIEAAVQLVRADTRAGRYDEVATLLRQYPEFLKQSNELLMHWAWSLYREGNIGEATRVLLELQRDSDNQNVRSLEANIAITSGDWGSLGALVEREWAHKDARNAIELIRTAALAISIGAMRAKELLFASVEKGSDDLRVLLSAYELATRAGWDSDEKVAGWLASAAAKSGPDGPIKRIELKELLELNPKWERQSQDMWQQMNAGNVPLFLASKYLNKTLVEMHLFAARANAIEPDARKRAIVPTYSGARSIANGTWAAVGFDPTAILTIGLMNVFDEVAAATDVIVIPHSTLSWLFDERRRIAFHQPSRIKDAHEIRQLIASGQLIECKSDSEPNTDLAAEIGPELAQLLAAANGNHKDDTQRLVIHPFPVHRLASFMEEEADLTSHAKYLCSSNAIVDKLKAKALITASEEERARAYLSLHEKDWPSQPLIKDNAHVYFDDIAIGHLQHTRLLSKIKGAGLTAYISGRKVEETNALIRYERLSHEVQDIVERVRKFLADGIKSGKVRLGNQSVRDVSDEESALQHPSAEVLQLADEVDAIVIDDRAINHHTNVGGDTRTVPLLTSLDLLASLEVNKKISTEVYRAALTTLRQANFIFVPVTPTDLGYYLAFAKMQDGQLVETAELKAVRENIVSIKLGKYVQLPREANWFESTRSTLLEVLKEQWLHSTDSPLLRARANWLLRLADIRGWMHIIPNAVVEPLGVVEGASVLQLMNLIILPPGFDATRAKEYMAWLEEEILTPIREEQPRLYAALASRVKAVATTTIIAMQARVHGDE